MFKDDLLAGQHILITGGGTGLGKSMGRRFLELRGEAQHLRPARGGAGGHRRRASATATGGAVQPSPATSATRCGRGGRRRRPRPRRRSRRWSTTPPATSSPERGAVAARGRRRGRHRAQGLAQLHARRSAGAGWRKDRRGTVLSIVTSYAWTGSAYVLPSAVAKAGVLAMTRSLAVEWGGAAMRLNAIAPGPFPTEGAWERLVPRPDLAARFRDPQPACGRVGEHRELANLAAYLLADGSAYINGEVVAIDGGEWLQGAGQFSFLMEMLGEDDWAGVAAETHGAELAGEESMPRSARRRPGPDRAGGRRRGGRCASGPGSAKSLPSRVRCRSAARSRSPTRTARQVTDQEYPRPVHAGLFRLHLLPRHLPARAADHRRGARRVPAEAAGPGGADLHHRRPGARHGGGDAATTWPRSPRLVGLTGSEAEIAQAVRAYRVYASKADAHGRRRRLPGRPLDLHLPDGPRRPYLTHFGHDTTPEEMAQRSRPSGRRRLRPLPAAPGRRYTLPTFIDPARP